MSRSPLPEQDDGIATMMETISVPLRVADITRIDHAAERRGISRDAMIAEAIDAFLAREIWSGGFIAPPPPLEVTRKYPWSAATFRLRRRE